MPATQKRPAPKKWAAILRTKPTTANKDNKRKHVAKKTKYIPAALIPFDASRRADASLALLAMHPQNACVNILPTIKGQRKPSDPHYFEIKYTSLHGSIGEVVIRSKAAKTRDLLLKQIKRFFLTLEIEVYGEKQIAALKRQRIALHYNSAAVAKIVNELKASDHLQLERAD